MLTFQGHDADRDLPYVDQLVDGRLERRYLAARPTPDDHLMRSLPTGPDMGIGLIERVRWPELFGRFGDRRFPNVPILDQDGIGECVATATSRAMMLCMARAMMPVVELSAPFLYSLINGGWDRGSNAGDACQAASTVGVCAADLVAGRPIRPKGISAAAVAGASRFKMADMVQVDASGGPVLDQVVTLVLYGFQILFDVQAGNGYTTDADGSVRYGGRFTNHEQTCGEGLRILNGRPQILGSNSWGTSWGRGGYGWFGEEFLAASNTIIAVKSVAPDTQDHELPPLLAASAGAASLGISYGQTGGE